MDDTKQLSDEITANFTEAEKAKKDVMTSGFPWDEREQLFRGIYKAAAEKSKSDEKAKNLYSTGELESMILDSACRVMAQMPTGRFEGDEETIARVIAANLVYHNFILPNANSGGDFFTKQRQANIYSKIYGTMPAFIDFVVNAGRHGKYTGPDLVLVHPRRFLPQPGKYSIVDMDWCFVDVPKSKSWLESRAKANPEVWDPKIIAELNPSQVDKQYLTMEEQRTSQDRKDIVLRNYFTCEGDWTIYEPTSQKVIFSEKDYWPGIPLVEKLTIPLLDRYFGRCDLERGETPQKSIDSLVRKFFEAVDKSIDPTTVIDPENMVMSSVSIKNKFWFAKDGKTTEPRVLNSTPAGLDTFQVVYNIMKANMLSMSAQTDTSVPSSLDVGFGKTPEALKKQDAREGARDSWDRYMQEKFLGDCANMMMAVASKRGMGQVKIPGIQAAIEKIKTAYPDQELKAFENGIVEENLLADLRVSYKVDPGSTAKQNDAGEKTMAFLEGIAGNSEIMQQLKAEGKKINWGEALKRVAIDKGIQDYDKIIVSAEDPNSVAGVGDSGGTVVRAEQPQEAMPTATAKPQDVPQF